MPKEKSCGALVYREWDGKIQFLILRHRLGGHWSFPKGHVEPGETEVQTALREVLEETGLRIALIDGFRHQVAYSPRTGIYKEVVYFLGYAEDSHTTRQEEEISEIRWIDMEAADNFLSFDNDRQLIRSAKRHLHRYGSHAQGPQP